ncbi:M1-specific T cell receptor beta chain-like [Enoplosus armatus]|uniref:M1-specific T cell receptor beta chain-like n=1 Tax=Enoplosus armatus TaxID=215367 RepID=UPI0039957848
MISPLIICTVSLLCAAGVTWTEVLRQTRGLLVERGRSAQMNCRHSAPGSYYHMYWFQQLPGESMKLVVHTVPYQPPDFGNFSQDKYSANKTVSESGSFTVKHVEPSDNGVYLCAVSGEGDSEAYFGTGTRLTVLDPGRTITPPRVKVFKPSQNECQNSKDRKNKKTLVCLGFGFYPDHVSVSWQIEGVNVTDGVATDDAALWDGEHYSVTSRLRVPLRKWFTPGLRFTCTVSFFDGNATVHRSNWVEGVEGPGALREKYLRITHAAKLSYTVLIIKSSIYGAFVAFLVWRLQGSSGKQDD